MTSCNRCGKDLICSGCRHPQEEWTCVNPGESKNEVPGIHENVVLDSVGLILLFLGSVLSIVGLGDAQHT